MGDHAQTGLAACFSVDEYERDIVRKHERTRKDKEDDRTRHIVELRAQTGPVFLTYPAAPAIDALAARITADAPLVDFTASDGIRHTIWQVPAGDVGAIVDAFGQIPVLYIADGHHRAASAMRAKQSALGRIERGVHVPCGRVPARPDADPAVSPRGERPQRSIGVVIPRRDFGSVDRPRGRSGAVGQGPRIDVLDGAWHDVTLGAPARDASPADQLDVSLLQDQVLAPLLGVGDPRTDKRIDFVGGIRGTGCAEPRGRSGPRRGRIRVAPGQRGRPHGHRGRGRHHAAEVHMVRAEAA